MIKKIFVLFGFGVVLLVLCFKFFDLRGTLAHYESISYWYLPLLFLTLWFTFYLRAARWSFLLKKLVAVERKEVFRVYAMGAVIDFLIPVRISEIIKCNYVKRHHGVSLSKVLPTVFIDKLFDVSPILVILSAMPFLQYEFSREIYYVVYFLLGVILLGVFFLAFVWFHVGLVMRFRRRSQSKRVRKILAMFLHFVSGFRKLNFSFSLFCKMFLLSLLAMFFNCVAFYLCVLALQMSISFVVVLLGYSLLFLSFAVPSPPGQMGSNEMMALIIFSGMLGLQDSMVGALVIFSHILIVLFTLGMGLYLLKTFKKEMVLALAFFEKRSKN